MSIVARASGFRSDINGLRAWAVAGVLLYHFGTPGIGGGFAGVDVFFVISGFLMTGLVTEGLKHGRFRLVDFYLARARRIVPALLALCAALLLAGVMILPVEEYTALGQQAQYALLFSSNHLLAREAGYFAPSANEQWLLHTWSLSVEWQFYLLLPVALAFMWRLAPRVRLQQRALAICGLLSLVICIAATEVDRDAAYYFLPMRAWQMCCGGIVYHFSRTQSFGEATGRKLEIAGLLLIAGAFVLFDSGSPWPGWRALIPVAGAGLVMLSPGATILTRSGIAQWLGDRSYSLYLWHWPVVVALAYLDRSRDAVSVCMALAVTLGLAHASFHLVEQPFRRIGGRSPLRAAVALGIPLAVFAVAGAQAQQLSARASMLPAAAVEAAAASQDYNPRRKECHALDGTRSPSCRYGGSALRAVVIGDSHAGALMTAISRARAEPDSAVMQWSYSACPYIRGLHQREHHRRESGRPNQCAMFIHWTTRQLDAVPEGVPIVLVGRYAKSAMGSNEEFGHEAGPEIFFSREWSLPTAEYLADFSRHLVSTSCALAARHPVYLVRPIPEMGVDVPRAMSRRLAWGDHTDVSIPRAEYEARNGWVWQAQDVASRTCGVHIIDPLPYLCDATRCYGSRDGHPLYYDDDHLNESANRMISPLFAAVFQGTRRADQALARAPPMEARERR